LQRKVASDFGHVKRIVHYRLLCTTVVGLFRRETDLIVSGARHLIVINYAFTVAGPLAWNSLSEGSCKRWKDSWCRSKKKV